MSGTGVLSKRFSMYVENTTNAAFTIAPLGFQYEIIGVRAAVSGASVVSVRQTDAAGLLIATMTTAAAVGSYFINLDATRANRQITSVTTAIYVSPGNNTEQIEIQCIGIEGVTPPGLLDGVPGLTIT